MRFDVAAAAVRAAGGLAAEPVISFRGEHAFLANPHPCVIWFENTVYPSAEHAFHGAKSLDWEERERIARLGTWQQARRMGRAIRLRPGWDQLRGAVMLQVQLCKYTQHPDLCAALLATAKRVLVEGNWHGDTDWGAVAEGHPKWSRELPWWPQAGKTWAGHNWLGVALMMTREMLALETP
jgi:ribA/ribD-fused uncharacterized protein